MEHLLLLCCRSCLKGENDQEYYAVLQLIDTDNNNNNNNASSSAGADPQHHGVHSPKRVNTKKITTDDIKKAYKKISLSLHPDKLAQRGIENTAEKRQEFLKVSYYLQ
jgi:hypothetical protein